MDKEKRKEIVEISGIAFMCFKEVMDSSNEKERAFMKDNFDIFINIFNNTVLTTFHLLMDKEELKIYNNLLDEIEIYRGVSTIPFYL